MGKLIYSAITSLDGYIADASGRFDWAMPDEAVHAFINDLVRPVGTLLYGRRMYETMKGWETMEEPQPVMQDFAQLWRAAEKVVYSTTLNEVSSARTRIERAFDPEDVRRLKREATGDLGIGGAGLAAHAIAAGLVDEYHLFLAPAIVGGGTPALPDAVRLDLGFVASRSFDTGMVYLHYHTGT